MPTLQAAAGESGNNKPMVFIEENGSRESLFTDLYNGQITGEVATTLTAESGSSATNSGQTVLAFGFKPQQGAKAHGMGYEPEKSPTLTTTMNAGVLCLNDQGGSLMNTDIDISGTLRAQANGHQPIIMDGSDT